MWSNRNASVSTSMSLLGLYFPTYFLPLHKGLGHQMEGELCCDGEELKAEWSMESLLIKTIPLPFEFCSQASSGTETS